MERSEKYKVLLEEFRSLNGPRFSSESSITSNTDDFRIEYPPDPSQTFPELASELENAQEVQFTELQSKEEAILMLKEELHKGKERLDAIQHQIASATMATCLAKEDAKVTGAKCGKLQTEIELKASVIEGHHLKLQRAKQAQMSLANHCTRYREKMGHHRAKLQEVEQRNATQQELEAVLDKLKKLKEKKQALTLEGHTQEALLYQKSEIDVTRELLEEENASLQHKLTLGQNQLDQIRTELGLAKKKQQAQVTRLLRQLQEAQVRRRQWGEKAEQLKGSIKQFKLKMEE